METLQRPKANEMIQIRFDGSETELIEYVLRNRSLPPRAYKENKKTTPKKADWKVQLRKIAGIWEDRDDAQEEFRKIRESFNSRIPQ